MPIYEYECTKCHEHIEVFQKVNDDSLTICKKCKGELIRIISHTGFVLKGAGFYVNDHPSQSRKDGMNEERKGLSHSVSESPKTSEKTESK
jgi:putative FmdB family regulatory protein